jgi:protein-L-isoaspartate(D-aspartate) O-methyltransferase
VLEVGTGSGYQAAVLSVLAREVYSIELDRLLGRTAENRLASLGYANVHVRVGDGFYGWPEMAPFDRIIITAVAPRIPETLVAQLKIGGTLVMPIEQEERQVLVRARKTGDAALSVEEHGSVAFVPMLGAVRK